MALDDLMEDWPEIRALLLEAPPDVMIGQIGVDFRGPAGILVKENWKRVVKLLPAAAA
jgi:hypothetical protein